MANLSVIRKLLDVSYDKRIKDSPGVYVLFRTIDGPERYVGRSDTSLRNRLITHRNNNNYKYYRFKNCSLKDTYIWECKYWHKFQDTIDNSQANGGSHPAAPNGKNWYCPICGK